MKIKNMVLIFWLLVFTITNLLSQGNSGTSDRESIDKMRDIEQQPGKVMDVIKLTSGMIVGEAGASYGYFTFNLSNRVGDNGSINDSLYARVKPLWERSFKAWASNDPKKHELVNKEIADWRKVFDRGILPYTKQEMESIPSFSDVLPTWNSLQYVYLSELKYFNKKWLAIFGEVDRVVPTETSVKNIIYYMSLSGNNNYSIAVIPECGHAPVNVETKRMIRIDNISINWLNDNVINSRKNSF